MSLVQEAFFQKSPVQQSSPADPELLRIGSRLIWTTVAAMTWAAFAAYWAAGLSVDCSSFPALALVLPICLAISLVYRFARPDVGIVYSTEAIAQIFLISFMGALLAYAAATLRLPYHDAELIAADRWLGLDLKSYIGSVNARPWLALVDVIAYLSMTWQPAIVFVALTLSHRLERLHDFAIALAVSLLITIAIFALYPALGWYGHAGIDESAYPRLQLFWNFAEHLHGVRSGALRTVPLGDLHGVRSGALRTVPLGDLRGIISFPSYHTAAAVLAIWSIWPVRLVRWPMVLLNVLMVASAPIEGSHYFIDIIGGAAVGLVAIMVAGRIRQSIRRYCAQMRRAALPAAPALAG